MIIGQLGLEKIDSQTFGGYALEVTYHSVYFYCTATNEALLILDLAYSQDIIFIRIFICLGYVLMTVMS